MKTGMKNIRVIISCLGLAVLAFSSIYAQETQVGGFRYQGVVRDPSGRPLPGTPVTLQILLSEDARMGNALYIETHQVVTGPTGEFGVVVGEGSPAKGSLEAISWSEGNLWLHVALQNKNGRRTAQLLSSSRLPVVPYALHALSTSRVIGSTEENDTAIEKQQSVFWLSSGNSLTKPGTHFLGTRDSVDLIFKTNGQTRMTVTSQGQVKYKAGSTITGEDKFPVHIKGASQGIHIKVDGSRDSSRVFVDFGDDENTSWGRIEGQTFEEWKKSDLEEDFKFGPDVKIFKLAELGGAVAAMVVTIGGAIATGIGAAEAISMGLDMAAIIAELAYYNVSYSKLFSDAARYQGVTYSSGAADYAEYLERAPGQRNLKPGEVVGVKNGQVSLITEGADHLLAVSSSPIALGNLPKESEKERFEKIGFMGQVLVRVTGAVNIGDYILPSGNNDGLAIAVAPDKMLAADYGNIIGVAWSQSNPAGLTDFQFINVAIGINAFELSRELVRLERQVGAIKAYLKGESSSFKDSAADKPLITKIPALSAPDNQAVPKMKLSIEEHARLLDENAHLIEQAFQKANATLPDEVKNHPQVIAMMKAPVLTLKEIYRDPSGYLSRLEEETLKELKKR